MSLKNFNNPENLQRRSFLRNSLAGCAGMSSVGALSGALNLQLIGNAAAATRTTNDYRALVCVFLLGGNDSYNMVVRRDNEGYNEYNSLRGTAAIPQADLLPLNLMSNGGASYGLHPSLSSLVPLFNTEKLGVVSNVGTLIQPMTADDYISDRLPLPIGMRSHSDQQIQWQTAMPQIRGGDSGWLGRVSDLFAATDSSSIMPHNFSVHGNNLMLSGQKTSHFTVTSDGPVTLLPNNNILNSLRRDALKNIAEQSYFNFIEKSYAGTVSRGETLSESFAADYNNAVVNTVFPETDIGAQLQTVARTIAVRNLSGAKSQTFYVALGGWDHHSQLNQNQYPLMKSLGDALAAFQQSMEELDVEDNVTTFTASDFGRRLQGNSNLGTDHGWGGMQLVMGGAVKGNQIHGHIPTVARGGSEVLNIGMLPTMSLDEFYAEMAIWYGVPANDLSLVLPNIGNFYNTSSGVAPVGYLL